MRGLSYFLVAAALVVGFLVGFAMRRPDAPAVAGGATPSVASMERLRTPDLGALLMARVGRRLHADSRNEQGLTYGVRFYTDPKPYGSWLCWVDAYEIPSEIVRGDDDPNQEDLRIQTRYGIWRHPTAPEGSAGDREEACAAFRDFTNMIVERSPGTAERAAYLLDVILQQVQSRRATFTLSCNHLQPKEACDPNVLLRGVALKQLGYVETKSEKTSARSTTYEDELWVNTGLRYNGGDEIITFNVVSEQPLGPGAGGLTIRSVAIAHSSIL